MGSNPKNVILVDGNHLVYRCWHTQKMLSTREGFRTGAIHGFLNSILSVSRKYPDSSFIMCWEGGKTWRQSFSKDYKANRGKSVDPEFMLINQQFAPLQEILDIIGFRQCRIKGLEADDIIGILSKTLEQNERIEKVYILSGDRDFFQLITDKTHVLRMENKGLTAIKTEDVKREFGITPVDWVKMRALCGDPSDNLKPVKGIGPKKAVGFIHAGLDTSVPAFEKLPMSSQKQFRELRLHWTKIYECYVLSNIPRDDTFDKFSSDIRTDLQGLINEVRTTPGKLPRSAEEKEENLEYLTQQLAQFELNEILGDRTQFWQIP